MPRDVLEAQYGMLLPPPGEDDEADSPPTAYQLAGAYACEWLTYRLHLFVNDATNSKILKSRNISIL